MQDFLGNGYYGSDQDYCGYLSQGRWLKDNTAKVCTWEVVGSNRHIRNEGCKNKYGCDVQKKRDKANSYKVKRN